MTHARRMWPAFETYHAHIYFVPEAAEAYRQLGFKGGWMGYFASRAAPLGAAPPELVTAVFFNFNPAMVARALPDAWGLAAPEDVLASRLRTADVALRRLIPDQVGAPGPPPPPIIEAAALAREAAEVPALAGRPLFAALRALPWPDEPHLVLWHACTLLREHRGDGHVAALTAAGLDGCEAHVTLTATGDVPRPTLQGNRKWTDEDWAAAEERLRSRGWLDAEGNLTAAGRSGRAEVESRTDALAEAPWEALGPDRTARLLELLTPLARAISAAGGVPVPNPVGVPAP